MLAYEEDRRDKATRDRREKEVREARIVAGLPPTDSPTITSTSSGGRTRRKRMIMPGSGMTLDGRTAAGDHDAGPGLGSPPPYPDDGDEDDDGEEDI